MLAARGKKQERDSSWLSEVSVQPWRENLLDG